MRSLIAGLALMIVAVGQSLAADLTARISLQLPLKSHLGQNLLMFKEEVEAASNGSIAVEIYDSAQLYKDKVFDLEDDSGHVGTLGL